MQKMTDKDLIFISKTSDKDLYNHQGFVELWDFSSANINDDSRIEAVSTVASVCYGNQKATNPEILYNRLKRENMGIPTSTFEFIRHYKNPDIENSFRNNPDLDYTDTEYKDKQKNTIITFRIKIPLFVSKQIMRHRQAAWQELSRRFVGDYKASFELYTPPYFDKEDKEVLEYHYVQSLQIYNSLRSKGYKKGIARCVMPVSYMTVIWIQMSKKWFNYLLSLRTDDHVQKETRELALSMKELAIQFRPNIIN